MTQSAVTEFCVVYDGVDHENHVINITTLGKSLTALGNALKKANEILNGDSSTIDVRVNADLVAGSFGFLVEVIQSLPNAKDVLQVLGLLGGGSIPTTSPSNY